MSDTTPTDLVRPSDVTKDFLYAFFNDAYFNVHRDDVGDVYLKEPFTVWVFPQGEGEQIRLMAQFAGNADMPRIAKLEYANSINDKLKLLRAYVDDDEDLGFDYYVSLEGGITRRSIALAARRFIEYVRTALQRDTDNVIQ